MDNPPPSRDLVATVLAFAVGSGFFALVVGAVGLAWTQERPISEAAVTALTAIGGGLVGVLGAYMGFRHGIAAAKRGDEKEPVDKGPDPG